MHKERYYGSKMRPATVHLTFSIEGIVGRETYVTPHMLPHVNRAAWAAGRLEEVLIDVYRFRTWECGCCLNDERFELISYDVVET